RAGLRPGDHCLAGVDVAQDHGAVHGRADEGALERGLRLPQRSFALLHHRTGRRELALVRLHLRLQRVAAFLGLLRRGARLAELRRRDEAFVRQRALALEVALGGRDSGVRAPEIHLLGIEARAQCRHRALRGVEIGAGLVHPQLVARRLEARDDLAFLNRRVVVRIDLLYLPRNRRGYLDSADGVQRAACRDRYLERAALDLGEAIAHLIARAAHGVPGPCARGGEHEHERGEERLLHARPGLGPTPSSRGWLTRSGGMRFWPRRCRPTTSQTGSPLTPSRTGAQPATL